MFCIKCGNVLDDDAKFCANCGTLVGSAADGESAVPIVEPEPQAEPNMGFENLSLKEFYDRYASKNTRSWVTAMVVIAFLTAALSLILVVCGAYSYLIGVIFFMVMGALLLTKRHWGIALAITIYGGIGSLLSLAMDGTVGGVFALIAGVMSTIALKKLHKAYKEYQTNKTIPRNLI